MMMMIFREYALTHPLSYTHNYIYTHGNTGCHHEAHHAKDRVPGTLSTERCSSILVTFCHVRWGWGEFFTIFFIEIYIIYYTEVWGPEETKLQRFVPYSLELRNEERQIPKIPEIKSIANQWRNLFARMVVLEWNQINYIGFRQRNPCEARIF